MIGPIDSIEFRMTSNTAEHLAQLQSVIITAKSVLPTSNYKTKTLAKTLYLTLKH